MNQIWNEADIIIIDGEKYLNDEASERLYQVYKDKLSPRGKQVYKLSWAERVCKAVPRMYQPESKAEPKDSPAAEQELEGANAVYNLANVKLLMQDFEKAYSNNPNIDLVDYLLKSVIRVVSARPITSVDMINFGNYIASQPQYKSVIWRPDKLEMIIEQRQIEAIYNTTGLESVLKRIVKEPYQIISIIKMAQKKQPLFEIEIILANYLDEKEEDFQNETLRLLEANGMEELAKFIKNSKEPAQEPEPTSEIEKYIVEQYGQIDATSQTKEQWLAQLLDRLYLRFNVKAEDVKDLLIKTVVDKEPYKIDILTLSRMVIAKDKQLKSCERDSDILIEELIINAEDTDLINNLNLVFFNVDDAKWSDFINKLVSRIHSDLESISVVDPVTIRRLYNVIIISSMYHDRLLITKLANKFGMPAEELVAAAQESLASMKPNSSFGEEEEEDTFGDDEDEEEYDEEEEFEIVSRRKPMTSEGKKKILYASIAGVGVISTLFLTFVQGYNPVTVVAECVKTFGALIKHNATLGQLGTKLGQLSVYFASIIVSFKSMFKFADTYDETKVSRKKAKKRKKVRRDYDEDDEEFEDDEELDDEELDDDELEDDELDDDYILIGKSDLFDGFEAERIRKR